MGLWTHLPFALFVLVDLDAEIVSQILDEAKRGCSVATLWLATQDYNDAPKKRPKYANEGTQPPISDDWKSPWKGHRVEDAAKWLQEKPDDVDLDLNHFAILDMEAKDGKSIIVCKIGDQDLHGDALSFRRREARYASSPLLGMDYGSWEEQFEGVKGSKYTVEVDYGDRKEVKGPFPTYNEPA